MASVGRDSCEAGSQPAICVSFQYPMFSAYQMDGAYLERSMLNESPASQEQAGPGAAMRPHPYKATGGVSGLSA